MNNDSEVNEIVDFKEEDTIYTILNNMKKTGQLDNLSHFEVMEELELLINQLDLDEEYLVNLSSIIECKRHKDQRKICLDYKNCCRDNKIRICQY